MCLVPEILSLLARKQLLLENLRKNRAMSIRKLSREFRDPPERRSWHKNSNEFGRDSPRTLKGLLTRKKKKKKKKGECPSLPNPLTTNSDYLEIQLLVMCHFLRHYAARREKSAEYVEGELESKIITFSLC